MIMRFGYVSTALQLWEASPSRTLTFTRWKALNKIDRTDKLHEVCKRNIEATKRMIHFNIAHQILVYRFSSSIIPLATHKEVEFDYISTFYDDWLEIGDLVKKHQLRVSFHPNQFTLFTSPKEQITLNAVEDMKYHFSLLEAMGIHHKSSINIHIGGAYGDKNSALLRFHQNISLLPDEIKRITTLENDDKTYTTDETLQVCQKEKMKMVFDYHHHMANLDDSRLEVLLPSIFETWNDWTFPPKIHISSPKSDKEFRSHSDYVDADFVKPLIQLLQPLNRNVDFMIEAKKKDKAALQLVEDISKWRGFKRIEEAMIVC